MCRLKRRGEREVGKSSAAEESGEV